MKDILIRKIHSDGVSWNNFKYPMEIGEWVEAPDWSLEKKCGGGLHGLLNFKGDWNLLNGSLWMVITDLEGLVVIDDKKAKIRKGRIDYIGGKDGLYEKYKECVELFDSEQAYGWARYVGHRKILIDKIVEPEWAYMWGYNIGNRDVMINRITNSEWAFKWARYIGNEDIMINRVKEFEWISEWEKYFG